MTKIEKQAKDFRKHCNISLFSPIDLKKLPMLLKFHLIFSPYNRKSFSGIALKKDSRRFMLINSGKTMGHQNFTIAHELYHLYIQKNFNSMICETGYFSKTKDINEKKADYFAINFLIPIEAIHKYFENNNINTQKINIKNIIELENYFSVSHHATLIHLKEHNIIDDNKYNQFFKGVINQAVKLGLNNNLYKPTNSSEQYSGFEGIIKELFNKNKISSGKYRELLQQLIKKDDLEVSEYIEEGMDV